MIKVSGPPGAVLKIAFTVVVISFAGKVDGQQSITSRYRAAFSSTDVDTD